MLILHKSNITENILQIVCFCCSLFLVQLSVIFAVMMAQRDSEGHRVCIIYFYDNTTANLAGISASKIIIKYSAHTFCQSTTVQSPQSTAALEYPSAVFAATPRDFRLGLGLVNIWNDCKKFTNVQSARPHLVAADWHSELGAKLLRGLMSWLQRGQARPMTSNYTNSDIPRLGYCYQHTRHKCVVCLLYSFLGVYHSFYCDSD